MVDNPLPLRTPHGRRSLYLLRGKRFLDIVVAGSGLLLGAPLLLLVGALVRQKLGRPVLFLQTRSGREGRPFVLYKFRSMTDAVDRNGDPLSDEQRLPRFGRWLRASSLDELPQLWNVVRGEMSLVGPRPLLPEYDEHYSAEQRRRLEVRPGITGWAQVRGRNTVSWSQRLSDDVWYVDHCGLATDLRVLAYTLLRVIRPKGISAEGHATMPSFITDSTEGKRAA